MNSKIIRNIKYDESSKKLYITYNNAKTFLYLDINKNEYLKLIKLNTEEAIEKFNQKHSGIQAI